MKAWEVLEQKGWCQGHMTNDAGAHCTLGAIAEAYGTLSRESWDKEEQLRSILKSSVASWNDRPGQIKEQVMDVLKQADI